MKYDANRKANKTLFVYALGTDKVIASCFSRFDPGNVCPIPTV